MLFFYEKDKIIETHDRTNLRKRKQDFFSVTIYNKITQEDQMKERQGDMSIQLIQQAKKPGAPLHLFNPLVIKIITEGGSIMNYRMERILIMALVLLLTKIPIPQV